MITRDTQTPWGRAQSIQNVADGIVFVGTPSHGGFWLAPEHRKTMHKKFKAQSASKAYYEEDCDALLVYLAFPEIIKKHTDISAITKSAQFWFNVDGSYKVRS